MSAVLSSCQGVRLPSCRSTAHRSAMQPFKCMAAPSRAPAAARVAGQQQAAAAAPLNELAKLSAPALATLIGYLTAAGPAAAVADSPFSNGVQSNSLYVTLALFVMCVPGEVPSLPACPTLTHRSRHSTSMMRGTCRSPFWLHFPAPCVRPGVATPTPSHTQASGRW